MAAAGNIQDPAGGPGRPSERLGLVRDRLTSRFANPESYLVGRVVAPAGSGKSRLLAQVAHLYPGPVAWCGTPDPVPRTEAALVGWVWRSIAAALGADEAPSELTSVEELVAALTGSGPPVLVVVDDMHLLEGSDAETALTDLVRRIPPRLRVLLASRVNLGLDLSRLRVSGQVVEVDPDDLRFRTWEVEELFRDIYRDPLLPEDVATLARRTAGWAAYLQLFHLATARKPQGERRQVLATLATRTRLVQEYLSRHVLAELAPELQDFLVRTSVLRRPSGPLCDEFLGWSSGSAEMLAELERRRLFTERVDDNSYRYHTVLLSYLDAKLVETIGFAAAKEQHNRAAVLLERDGWAEDALAAFAKSEDWEGVARTLGHAATSAADLGDAWLEALPPAVVETDSMLLLARARRSLASGALTEAVRIMRDAEKVAVSSTVAERCRHERERVAVWVDTGRASGSDWVEVIRQATQRHPAEAQRRAAALPGASGRFAEGVAAHLAGDAVTSGRVLRGVAAHPDAAPPMAAGAWLLGLVAGSWAGKPLPGAEVDRVREEVEAAGIPWLTRVSRAVLLTAEPASDDILEDLLDACERESDRWGAAVVGGIGGVSRLVRNSQSAAAPLARSATIFNELGAGVPESAMLGYLALAALQEGNTQLATSSAHQARTLAALLEVPGSVGLAALALGRMGDERELRRAKDVLGPLGTWEWYSRLGAPDASGDHPVDSGPKPAHNSGNADTNGSSEKPGVQLRCLGDFSLAISGQLIDEQVAKPMERALLHLLASRAGERIHREALIEALWPEADRDAGLHRLQVAVSSLRRLLGAAAGDGQLLSRDGDSYRLTLPQESDVDLWKLNRALRQSGQARSGRDRPGEKAALAEALAAYTGPLLPGDGPADWAAALRASLQAQVADAAGRLASLRLEDGDPQRAAEAARAGLAADRYRDELWKLLIESAEQSGHHAEAGRARQAYAAVLDELGV